MAEPLTSWVRAHFEPGGGEPYLSYIVCGDVDTGSPLSRCKYRSEGIPEGLNLSRYSRAEHPEVLAGFESGPLGQELRSKSAEIVAEVERAPACLILQGTLPESPDLDYLRDTVGLLTWCLDNSGRIIFDVQTFEWWTPEDWRSKIFRPAAAVPRHHVVILVSEDDKPNTKWFHTRGMQKFGRPDISVRHVPPALKDGVIDLCNRFIDFQAFGGVVAEGEEVRMASLPPGGTVRHGGDLDDPDFNNVHMEIVWPGGL